MIPGMGRLVIAECEGEHMSARTTGLREAGFCEHVWQPSSSPGRETAQDKTVVVGGGVGMADRVRRS